MRQLGLTGRLILSGTLLACVVALGAGWALRSALHGSMWQAFEQRLELRADDLATRFEWPAGGVRPVYVEPRSGDEFGRIFSGWYWRLSDAAAGEALHSRSLWDAEVHIGRSLGDGRMEAIGPRREALFGISRGLELGGMSLRLEVYGPASPVQRELAEFDRLLARIVVVLVLVLVLASLLQARFALRPLARLRTALAGVERGADHAVGSGYGPDLDPLAAELDGLLARNARIVARARGHAADLAHALKRPLALLRSEADAGGAVAAPLVERESETMARLIDRHLARAGSGAGDQRRIEIAPRLTALIELMRQLHADRSLQWHCQVPEGLGWRGEATDFEEMLGNLLDNAGKWARHQVEVTVLADTEQVRIVIEDDGPGLSVVQREQAARRWQRFDESVPGTGLGLAITADIVATYEGVLELSESPLGGLRAVLRLPT